jgi:hypothetical protein
MHSIELCDNSFSIVSLSFLILLDFSSALFVIAAVILVQLNPIARIVRPVRKQHFSMRNEHLIVGRSGAVPD